MEYRYVCPCLLGVEGLVADELRFLEAKNVEAQNGRVLFSGGLEILARANLCSRFAERALVLLDVFEARSFEELFQGVKALPWEAWIGQKDAFPVKGRSLSSKLSSVPNCQSIIKKAVVERLKQNYKVSWFEETGSLHQIQFLILKDQVSVMLDATGAGLHKRGYRESSNSAPIKETLAAAMASLARVRPNSTVIDPCCGSGTIVIEAAMQALRIAPGLRRRFAAEQWEAMPAQIWRQERERAQDFIRRDASFTAFAYDIEEEALELTRANAAKAGVANRIQVKNRDLRDFQTEGEHGTVICNPPYGERLLDVRQAEELYRVMGKVFVQKPGWSYTVISPDDDFEACFGRRSDKRRKLYNGMIKCQVYQYFKPVRP